MKRVGGFLLFILFAIPCVFAGMYAGDRNIHSTIVAWIVGLGVGISILSCLFLIACLFSRKERTAKNFLGAAGMLLAGTLPSGYFIALPAFLTRPYQSHIAEYVAVAGDNIHGGATSKPVKGKIIPVNMKDHSIDAVFFELSPDFRPKSPEEVGTIAALWWEKVRVGTYGNYSTDAGAYRYECHVDVWDIASKTLIAEQTFFGSDPPDESKRTSEQSGEKPYKPICEFLNALPH